ncbi:MAG: hypothetical protein SFY68_05240 [Candidatus Sumerlaeia bacterium]|nr:hypothetical protein [Candidatus Sumerlaeia bacterium]
MKTTHLLAIALCLLSSSMIQSAEPTSQPSTSRALPSTPQRDQRLKEHEAKVRSIIENRTKTLAVADFHSTTSLPTYLHQTAFVADQTTAESRAEFRRKSVDDNIELHLKGELPVDSNGEKNWGGAYWTAGILNYDSSTVRESLAKAFAGFPELSSGFRRVVLQSAFTLYPTQYLPEVEAALPYADSPKAFAIAATYILRNRRNPETVARIESELDRLFPEGHKDHLAPQLEALREVIALDPREQIQNRPPLVDLLRAPFIPGRPVIFSFQRLDRNYPGIAVVRKPDGAFVRNSNGGIFHISQHARSRTNLPGTITYGNSPEGIYSIKGSGIASNEFIGPVPYLWSRIPVEADPQDYFFESIPESLQPLLKSPEKDGENPGWTKELYSELLPTSWREYRPMYEAWWAGLAGRSEMIIHGTTIDPEFYSSEVYYPHTPSAGCMGALEFWAPEDGSVVYSGQLELLKAFTSTMTDKGTLVIINIDDKPFPVRIDDVISTILEAEKKQFAVSTTAP